MKSVAKLAGSAPVLVAKDGVRTAEHYRDVFGFKIHLQAASETKRQPGQASVNVFVTDVDALYEELKSRGVTDLDGNHLCFGMESKR